MTTPILIHRCRFVSYVPSAINALAYNADSHRIACARANGDIEIWHATTWTLERTIPGIVGGGSIESLVWVGEQEEEDEDDDEEVEEDRDGSPPNVNGHNRHSNHIRAPKTRLLSAGLDGYVTEWDLVALAPKNRVESGGGAVWSMAVDVKGRRVALGCEDGCVRVFDVTLESLMFVASCDRQDGRILSVAYHPTKPIIAAGSSDSCIRLYSSTNYRLTSRLTVDTRPRDETLVWTLAYLSNGTLVSGDSLGTVSFWDADSNTLMRALKSHYADVLCLAATANGTTVYSSGVDRRVLQYCLVDNSLEVQQNYMKSRGRRMGKKEKLYARNWVLSGDRRFHSHDVRALALCEEKPIDALVSGGVDATFIVSHTIAKFPECKQQRQAMFPQRPLVSLAREARLVLARFDDHVKVWALGQSVESCDANHVGDKLNVIKKERLIAEVKIKAITNLTASAMSDDGTLLTVSDLFSTRLFSITLSSHNGPAIITRAKQFPSPDLIPGSSSITFTPDSKRVILAGTDSVVRVVDVSDSRGGEFPLLTAFTEHRVGRVDEDEMEDVVHENGVGKKRSSVELVATLSVSGDSQWLATGDLANRIHVFNLDRLKHHATLPNFPSQHATFSFSVDSSVLAVILASNEIFLYDAEKVRLTDWSRANSHLLPERLLKRPEHAMGIVSSETVPGKIVLWASDYMCTLDTRKALKPESHVARKRKKSQKLATSGVPATEEKKIVNGGLAHRTPSDTNEAIVILDSDDEDEAAAEEQNPAPRGVSPPKSNGGSGGSLNMQFGYGPTMFFEFLAGGKEAVIVERPVLSVIDSLPAGFYRKRYGS
ncbi:WD40-repeat-containing domain protein [Chytriomyces sp. MP71]|nr:WD40-repeat-containing domain protein [Chytriomyces sp. MP71]